MTLPLAMVKQFINRITGRRKSKVNTNVRLKSPTYADRHMERDFLVLATGYSLKKNKSEIEAFIKKYDPIILAGNNVSGLFVPHYHAFVNRKRFCTYAQTIHPETRVLLSPYFPDHIIQAHCKKQYEFIQFENKYPSIQGEFNIRNGIIYSEGATIGTILIAISLIMGAKDIYVAGMDGYSLNSPVYYYKEDDRKTMAEFLQLEESMFMQLESLEKILEKSGRGKLRIITPTAHKKFHRDIDTLI